MLYVKGGSASFTDLNGRKKRYTLLNLGGGKLPAAGRKLPRQQQAATLGGSFWTSAQPGV